MMQRAIERGLQSIRQAPFAQLMAMVAIAASLLLVAAIQLARENLGHLVSGWGKDVQLVVYLDETTPPSRAKQIADTIAKLSGVERVQTVDSHEALSRLKRSLGDRADLVDGVDESMLPVSIEVTLAETASGKNMPEKIMPEKAMMERLRRVPGVEDVEFTGDWVNPLRALRHLLGTVGLGLFALVALGCLAIVAATIRIRVLGRRDEIEILQLVGATDRFVSAPFLVEGTLQGASGAVLAIALLYALFRATAPQIEHALGSALCASPLSFLSVADILAALVGGALLGFLGSALAVGRHVRARA